MDKISAGKTKDQENNADHDCGSGFYSARSQGTLTFHRVFSVILDITIIIDDINATGNEAEAGEAGKQFQHCIQAKK